MYLHYVPTYITSKPRPCTWRMAIFQVLKTNQVCLGRLPSCYVRVGMGRLLPVILLNEEDCFMKFPLSLPILIAISSTVPANAKRIVKTCRSWKYSRGYVRKSHERLNAIAESHLYYFQKESLVPCFISFEPGYTGKINRKKSQHNS